MEDGVLLKWLLLLLVTFCSGRGGGGFEVVVAMLQGGTAAFSGSLGFSPPTQLHVSCSSQAESPREKVWLSLS